MDRIIRESGAIITLSASIGVGVAVVGLGLGVCIAAVEAGLEAGSVITRRVERAFAGKDHLGWQLVEGRMASLSRSVGSMDGQIRDLQRALASASQDAAQDAALRVQMHTLEAVAAQVGDALAAQQAGSADELA